MESNNQHVTPQPNRVKTYTERFQEMEAQLGSLLQEYVEANQAFSATASIVKDLSAQIRMMNDQLQAVYDLGGEGKAINRTSVTDKVNERRVKNITNRLDEDEKAGILKKIDTVQNDDSLIVYVSDEISLAFKVLAAFEADGIKNDLLGKKVGDTVGKITIKQVYEFVNPEQPEDAKELSNEQKQS